MKHYNCTQNEVMLAQVDTAVLKSAHSFAIHTKQADKNMCKHIHLQ